MNLKQEPKASCQPYLCLPLIMAGNAQPVWYHPSLMNGLKSKDQEVDQL